MFRMAKVALLFPRVCFLELLMQIFIAISAKRMVTIGLLAMQGRLTLLLIVMHLPITAIYKLKSKAGQLIINPLLKASHYMMIGLL